MSGYGEDLAFVHDDGFGEVGEAAARELGLGPGRVVDLGCGSGAPAAVLAAADFEVVGVDLSPSLLALARARVPEASFTEGSVFDFPPPPCRAVLAAGEVLGYAFDPASGRDALKDVIDRAFAALEPSGTLLFDLAGPATAARSGWREGSDWVACSATEVAGEMLVRKIVVFRLVGGAWRRSDEEHRVVLHDPEFVVSELRAVGFDPVETATAYGGVELPQGVTAFTARKPG